MSNDPYVARWEEEEEDRLDDELAPLTDEAALRRRVTRQINKKNEFRISLTVYLVMNAVFLVLFTALGLTWVAGVIALAWGSGVAAHGIDTWYQTGKRAATRLALTQQAYRDAYGPRWYETASRKQLVTVRRRVEEPINKRKDLVIHLAVYVFINAMLWWIYAAVMPGGFAWPLIVSGLWGVGLVSHAVDTFGKSRSEQSIEREVERQRALLAEAEWDSEKPKNDFGGMTAAHLSEDGELTDSMVREVERELRRNRH